MRFRVTFALFLTVLLCAGQTTKKSKGKAPLPPPEEPVSAPVQKPAGALRIVEAAIAQMEDGQAADASSHFVPGETIFASFLAENYKRTGQRVELRGEMEMLDPNGVPVAPKDTLKVATTLESEDKDWRPKFRSQFILPTIAPPGKYVVRMKVTDVQASQTATAEMKLDVTGPMVEHSEEPAIRQFGFFRGEDDPAPLTVAAFRPGDTLWAKFFLTGYKFGPENAIDVAYDIAVLDATGKELFAQKDAVHEKSKAFYPQPWIPSGMNLNLQGNMRAGTYTLTITLRDNISGKRLTEKHEFRVE